jgi:hypothetical protein
MKQAIFLLIICALIAIPCFAQDAQARKFDEFNQSYYAEARARTINLVSALAQEPDSTAYIIVYTGSQDLVGSGYRFANRLRNYLVSIGTDGKRVVAIAGGRRETQITELWIVPNGAKAPVPTSVFSPEQIPTDQLIKFDSYPVRLPTEGEWDVWDGIYEDETARLTSIAEVLKKRSDLRLYIVARAQGVYVYKPVSTKLSDGTRKYIQVRSSKLSDPIGFDRKLANTEKAYLIKQFGIEASRIAAVGNGYSLLGKSEPEMLSPNEAKITSSTAARSIELWLVPKNELKPVLKTILKP